MSPAACAGSPPGPRFESRGAAQSLCALSCGSGLAVAERMEHQTSTAFAGVQVGLVLGLEGSGLGGGLLRASAEGRRLRRGAHPNLGRRGYGPPARWSVRPDQACVPTLAARTGLRERFRPALTQSPFRRVRRWVWSPAGEPRRNPAGAAWDTVGTGAPSWSGTVSRHWPRRTGPHGAPVRPAFLGACAMGRSDSGGGQRPEGRR
jgi:hypothetical protein